MKFRNRFLTIPATLLAASGIFSGTSGQQASLESGTNSHSAVGRFCPPAWNVISSPNGNLDDNSLGDVDAISSDDMWAVGTTGIGANPINTLTEHWNGTNWTVVPSPNGIFPVNYLIGVAAVSSSDVWAVGYTDNGSVSDSQSRTLILHWNGTSWSLIPSPNTSRPNNWLYAVAAISPDDVWAVGASYNYSVYRTLILHWDGVSWSIVPSPNPSYTYDALYGVDAVSENNVWAVGAQSEFLEQTLVVHWDGSAWTAVPSPNIGPYGNNMLDVSARSATDVWAVGYHLTVNGFDQPYQTSAFHYDGVSWSAVPTPNMNLMNNYLFGVVGVAGDNAWAVGFWDTNTALDTMIQHWDGESWTIVPSPSPGAYLNELVALDALSANNIWAVGTWTDGLFGVNTLVQRFSRTCP